MKAVSSKLRSVNSRAKPKGKISYEDFLAHYKGTWAEWIDGNIIKALGHQAVLGLESQV